MKRLKKIVAAESAPETELHDLDRVAAKIEGLREDIDKLRSEYGGNSLLEMILDDVLSGLEKTRVGLLDDVRNHYDKDEYEDLEYLYWKVK